MREGEFVLDRGLRVKPKSAILHTLPLSNRFSGLMSEILIFRMCIYECTRSNGIEMIKDQKVRLELIIKRKKVKIEKVKSFKNTFELVCTPYSNAT